MPTRRFPQPWTHEDHNDACYIVKDANGVAIAYVYYEQDHGRRTAANLMTRDEARRNCGKYRQAARVTKTAALLNSHRPVWFDTNRQLSLNVSARKCTSRGKLSPSQIPFWLGLSIAWQPARPMLLSGTVGGASPAATGAPTNLHPKQALAPLRTSRARRVPDKGGRGGFTNGWCFPYTILFINPAWFAQRTPWVPACGVFAFGGSVR